METKSFTISLEKNPLISIKVIPGHFTTSNAHSNNYLDVSELKSNAMVARDVSKILAAPYISNTLVDTIVCMERTEVIGAYLAEELFKEGVMVINAGGRIHVVSPTSNINGNLVFQDSAIELILNKHILLLFASISSGHSYNSVKECLTYYGGNLVGVSTLFLASYEKHKEVNALFTANDIPNYKLFMPGFCEMCKAGVKLDAIVNSEGYTNIR